MDTASSNLISNRGRTPNFCIKYSKLSLGSVFVNISIAFSLVGIHSSLTSISCTFSLRKMIYFFECITRFLDILITLVLSQFITTSSSIVSYIPSSICFIHANWWKLIVVATRVHFSGKFCALTYVNLEKNIHICGRVYCPNFTKNGLHPEPIATKFMPSSLHFTWYSQSEIFFAHNKLNIFTYDFWRELLGQPEFSHGFKKFFLGEGKHLPYKYADTCPTLMQFWQLYYAWSYIGQNIIALEIT